MISARSSRVNMTSPYPDFASADSGKKAVGQSRRATARAASTRPPLPVADPATGAICDPNRPFHWLAAPFSIRCAGDQSDTRHPRRLRWSRSYANCVFCNKLFYDFCLSRSQSLPQRPEAPRSAVADDRLPLQIVVDAELGVFASVARLLEPAERGADIPGRIVEVDRAGA